MLAKWMGEWMAEWSVGCEVGLSVGRMGDMTADALVAIQVEQLAVLTVGSMAVRSVRLSDTSTAASMVVW